ncbi:DUF4012 domain-containing protein [Nocardioides sp. CPCC 206347]|uniref:DUF4012 domain-containing protein n=1 Tax=unclassified Nocardioides TaxID=2615069 RepID=UPI003614DBB7
MSPEVRRRRGTRLQRFGRKLRRLLRRRSTLVLLGVLALGLVWSVWVAVSAARHLQEVDRQAQILRAALVRGDADGVQRATERYQEAADTAASRTSGFTWMLFEAVPLLGDDAEGIATAARVLADIGHDGLPPVAEAAELVQAESFQPVNGVFPIDQIEGMVGPARQSEAAFDDAASALERIDSSHFVGPVRERYDELRSLVTDARTTLGSTYRAAKIIPRMMGTDRPRFYLMVLQNNAELRSGGGLPGALSLVRMKDGKVDIVEQADMADLGRNPAPVVKLTPEERRIFGLTLANGPVNATLTPDFVRSAGIIRARWEREVGGRLDGMFFLDPVAVSYLLRGTGPVAVPGYPPVAARNVVGAVENEVYRLTNDREVHSDYQQAVSEAVFDALTAGRGDTTESIRGLVAGVMEGRIRMHSFEPESQAEIDGTTIAGEFSDEAGDQPQVGVYINDGGPTKMQYYLKYDAEVVPRSCIGGRQDLAGSINFHSDTPVNAEDLPAAITGQGFPGQRVEPGHQLLVVYVTSPVGGTITSLSIDGQRVVNPVIEDLAGRSLARIGVQLEPQGRHRVDFVMRSGPGQEGDVDLAVTPGAFVGSSNGTVNSACRIR